MALDGWSNIHNEPIVCATITTAEGEVYITDTIDTSGNSHTAEYLAGITKTAIQSTELKYGCKVRAALLLTMLQIWQKCEICWGTMMNYLQW